VIFSNRAASIKHERQPVDVVNVAVARYPKTTPGPHQHTI
jgi:hypothetical protein